MFKENKLVNVVQDLDVKDDVVAKLSGKLSGITKVYRCIIYGKYKNETFVNRAVCENSPIYFYF